MTCWYLCHLYHRHHLRHHHLHNRDAATTYCGELSPATSCDSMRPFSGQQDWYADHADDHADIESETTKLKSDSISSAVVREVETATQMIGFDF